MMYVYRHYQLAFRATGEVLWVVGFYDPQGKWQPESDHESREEAAKRVHWLNGGEHGIEHGAA